MKEPTVFACVLFTVLVASAHAAYSTTSSSFSIQPSQILSSTDTNFKISSTSSVFLTRSINDTYIVLWGLVGSTDTVPVYTTYRRYLDPTTFKSVGQDTTLAVRISSLSLPSYASSTNGWVALVSNKNDANGYHQLYISTFLSSISDVTNVNTVMITANTGSSNKYLVEQVWFQDSYFYVSYYQTDTALDPKQLFVQGFKNTDPSILAFTSPVQLSTTSLSGGRANIKARCAKIPEYQNIFCMWRIPTKILYAILDISQSAPTASETTLVSDNGGISYTPNSVIPASNYYIILIDQSGGATTGFTFQISTGSSLSINLGNIPITLGSSFSALYVDAASAFYNGWFLITRQTDATPTTSQNSIQPYLNSSTVNGTARTLVADGSILQGLSLSDQAYYVLISDKPSGGTFTNAYLGQVYSRIGSLHSSIINVMPLLILLSLCIMFLLF